MKRKKKYHGQLDELLEKYGGTLDWFEEGELKSWVEAGNSPYKNPEGIIHEDGTPFDFIEWHRSASWVPETVTFEPVSYERILAYYTAPCDPSWGRKEKMAFLKEAHSFLSNEVSSLRIFLYGKNLIEEYMKDCYGFLESGTADEELPFD